MTNQQPKTPAELAPCPFCGGEAYYTESVNGSNMAYVGCAMCGITAKAALVSGPAPNQAQWSKDLRALWNRRDTERRCAQDATELERLRTWVNDLQSGMYINCVYCGHRCGPKESTPVSMADVLKEHIEQCPEHPMSKLKAELSRVRDEGKAMVAAATQQVDKVWREATTRVLNNPVLSIELNSFVANVWKPDKDARAALDRIVAAAVEKEADRIGDKISIACPWLPDSSGCESGDVADCLISAIRQYVEMVREEERGIIPTDGSSLREHDERLVDRLVKVAKVWCLACQKGEAFVVPPRTGLERRTMASQQELSDSFDSLSRTVLRVKQERDDLRNAGRMK